MGFAIRDIRYNIAIENTWAPTPPGETWAHIRRGDPSAYGGTTNSGNVWLYTADQGFEKLNTTGLAYGGWALAFGFDGFVYWQEQGYDGVRRRLVYWETKDDDTLAPGEIELLHIAPSSAGLLDVTVDGEVIPDFGQPTVVTLEDGTDYPIPKCVHRNGVYLGYANEGKIGVVAVLNGKLYTVWEGDPMSLPVRLDDDGLTAAVSGDLDGFIDFTRWKPRIVTPPDPIRPVSDVLPLSSLSVAGSYAFPRVT